jgi:hypothetical protein
VLREPDACGCMMKTLYEYRYLAEHAMGRVTYNSKTQGEERLPYVKKQKTSKERLLFSGISPRARKQTRCAR